MKKQILDEPIHDSFSDFLEKGETILWTASPKIFHPIKDNLVSMRGLGLAYLWFLLSIKFQTGIIGIIIGFLICTILFLLTALHTVWKNRKRSKLLYAISQKRIFFKLPYGDKKGVHQIEFEDIINIVVNEKTMKKKLGTIYFGVKNSQLIPFDTYDLASGERRHQPTFELIEKPQEVAKLIRERIKNVNAPI